MARSCLAMASSILALASLIVVLGRGLGPGMGLLVAIVGMASSPLSSTQAFTPATGSRSVSELKTSYDRDIPVSSEEGHSGLAISIAIYSNGFSGKPLAQGLGMVTDHDDHLHGQQRQVRKGSQAGDLIVSEATDVLLERGKRVGRSRDGERGGGFSLSLERVLRVSLSMISHWSSRVSHTTELVAAKSTSCSPSSSLYTTSHSSSSSSLRTSSSSPCGSSSPYFVSPQRVQLVTADKTTSARTTARRLLRVNGLLQERRLDENQDRVVTSGFIVLGVVASFVVGVIFLVFCIGYQRRKGRGPDSGGRGGGGGGGSGADKGEDGGEDWSEGGADAGGGRGGGDKGGGEGGGGGE